MSLPPRKRDDPRGRAAEPSIDISADRTTERTSGKDALATPRPPLSERLPLMSDRQLLGFQAGATRIAQTPGHVKRAAAAKSLILVEAEIAKRASEPRPRVTATLSQPEDEPDPAPKASRKKTKAAADSGSTSDE